MKSYLRSSRCFALVGAAVLVASTSAANAATSVNVAADNSTRETVTTFPTLQTTLSDPGPLYTGGGGGPDITIAPVTGIVTLNFNASLSAAFSASALGLVAQQSTDGHLVLNVHFDTPVSLTASILESGLFTTTGNGAVDVAGGEVVIEAVNPIATESHASTLSAAFDNGFWSAAATTTPFTGTFTDYQVIIDNDLIASATDGTACIFKKTFSLQLIPGTNTRSTPEPTTLSLLGLAAPALLLRRRRHLCSY